MLPSCCLTTLPPRLAPQPPRPRRRAGSTCELPPDAIRPTPFRRFPTASVCARRIVIRPFEYAIEQLASVAGYGPAIIIFTAGIKLLLFPLTKQQIESTQKMQAIGPAAKALQEKYRDRDPARLNVELQKLYQDNEVNPLAGCLPAFAQIPLFIGLYRSLLLLAKEDKLEQPFLWLPSLEGPVADYQQGIGWLTEWVNGAPKFGWADTAAYLVLPVLLVLSQYASMELLTPKSDDPAQAQSQAILKFLPLMIGWFSLNVPSGLGARLALARARTRPPTYAAPAAPTPRSPTARAAQASTGSPTTSSPPPRLSPSARWRQRWRSRWRAAAAARRRRWSRPRPRALAAGALAR